MWYGAGGGKCDIRHALAMFVTLAYIEVSRKV
jgi:hypothetical protein